MSSRVWNSLFVAAMVAVLGLASCTRDAAPEQHAATEAHDEHGEGEAHEEQEEGIVALTPEQIAAAGIRTGPVEQRPLSIQLNTTGEVGYEEDRLAHVSPRIPGRVVRVVASLGDRVQRGGTLAVIDSVELGQAKASFLTARTREDLARENREREEKLYQQRISSEREMIEAKARHLEAESERRSAEETLRLYGMGESETRALEPGGPSSSLLSVRAPISGEVVEKHVVIGELVTPDKSLFTVADLQHVWIWIDVYERDLANVHLKDDVEVSVEALPKAVFTGEVTYLAPRVEAQTRTVRARIDVLNPQGLLRPGMFAKVRLTDPHVQSAAASLVVPEGALVSRGEDNLVFVLVGEGRFSARPVKLGRREAGLVELESGLEANDQVVTEGAFFLKSELARAELGGGHSH